MHGIQIVNVIEFNVIPLALVKSIFIGQNRGPYIRNAPYRTTDLLLGHNQITKDKKN